MIQKIYLITTFFLLAQKQKLDLICPVPHSSYYFISVGTNKKTLHSLLVSDMNSKSFILFGNEWNGIGILFIQGGKTENCIAYVQ